jgi:hypothetical protein
MAMSADRLGAKLFRLRAQWESSTRPERRHLRPLKEFKQLLGDRDKAQAAFEKERLECEMSYRSALLALANRLPQLEEIRELLLPDVMRRGWGKPADPVTRAERTEQRGVDDQMLNRMHAEVEAASDDATKLIAQATLNHWIVEVNRKRADENREDEQRAKIKIGEVIRYWLEQTCASCDGTKWEMVAGTNRQSTKVCKACGGTGYSPVPQGQEGRWLANHMDQCTHRYRQRLRVRRKALGSIPPIDRLSKRMQPDDMKD